jgi:hypothetical protein
MGIVAVYLRINGLFTESVSSSDDMVPNGRIITEYEKAEK